MEKWLVINLVIVKEYLNKPVVGKHGFNDGLSCCVIQLVIEINLTMNNIIMINEMWQKINVLLIIKDCPMPSSTAVRDYFWWQTTKIIWIFLHWLMPESFYTTTIWWGERACQTTLLRPSLTLSSEVCIVREAACMRWMLQLVEGGPWRSRELWR